MPDFIATDSRANKRGLPTDDTDASQNRKRQAGQATEPEEGEIPNAATIRPQLPKFTRIQSNAKGTTTLADGTVITATPQCGFPSPQLSESVWRNVSNNNAESWKRKTGPKAWVRLYRGTYEVNAQATVRTISDIVAKFLEKNEAESEDILVSPPTAFFDHEKKYQPPYHFLLSGVTSSDISVLIEQK
ncbi:hypothetical protein BV22DRAFT_1043336, partial [Leucogyrophana mollusca]